MKKFIVALVAFLFLFSGCSEEVPENTVPEISKEESVIHMPEESEREEAVVKEPAEKEPNVDYEWENFIEEMGKHGYSKENIESLENYGFSRDEIKAMTWVDVVRGLSMMEFGLEREKVESALKILDDPESYNNENFVISGNNGTSRIELIEDFITAVENNEPASVCGIMGGYTFPYYFELSYEPDGVIETVQYSHHGVFAEEYIRVFDEEAFYCFFGKGGRSSLSFPKMQLFWDEKPEYSEEEISDMPVTPEEAKETARKILLSGSGHSAYLSEIGNEKGFGSYGAVIPDDFSDKADEYYKSLDTRYEGTFGIDGKPYHLVVFYDGESDVGIYDYISAEDKNIVFEVSMVDGGLMPVAYIPEPRIMLDKR